MVTFANYHICIMNKHIAGSRANSLGPNGQRLTGLQPTGNLMSVNGIILHNSFIAIFKVIQSKVTKIC